MLFGEDEESKEHPTQLRQALDDQAAFGGHLNQDTYLAKDWFNDEEQALVAEMLFDKEMNEQSVAQEEGGGFI